MVMRGLSSEGECSGEFEVWSEGRSVKRERRGGFDLGCRTSEVLRPSVWSGFGREREVMV